jgi:23S rRNA (uracil1939-C5)-methyltransferase
VLAGSRGTGEAQIALGRVAGAQPAGEGARVAPVVDLSFRGELAPAAFAALDALVREGAWAGARVTLEGVTAPATFGDPRPVIDGADGAPLRVAEGGFAQPSDEGGRRLAARVAELASPAGQHVVELFAGSGTLSVLLARGAASFLGVEQHEPAVRAARENLAARGLPGKMVAADAEAHPLPKRADVVVLDPPRTGARGAARALAASRPRRVVYVSCDLPTLARDLAILCGGRGAPAPPGEGPLAVESIDLFELFPQTSHVEAVVALGRAPHRRRPA